MWWRAVNGRWAWFAPGWRCAQATSIQPWLIATSWAPRLIQAIGLFFLGRVVIELGHLEIGRRMLPEGGLDEMARRRREDAVASQDAPSPHRIDPTRAVVRGRSYVDIATVPGGLSLPHRDVLG